MLIVWSFLTVSLTICPYYSLLLAHPADYIQCPYGTDVSPCWSVNTSTFMCSREHHMSLSLLLPTGVLQGDTLVPYLFIICLDYMFRTLIDKIRENGFELTKKRSRRYPAKTITDADYIVILANTPNQAKTLLHSLERAAAGIGLHLNAHRDAHGVMVIVTGYGHGDTSSIPGQD